MAQLTSSYLSVPKNVPFLDRTVGQQLYLAADKYQDKEMFVFYEDKERVTFQQIRDESSKLAASFLALGLQKGDVMAIIGRNHVEFLVALFACSQIGVIVSHFHLELFRGKDARIHFLKEANCKAVFITRSPSTLFEDICDVLPELNNKSQDICSEILPDLRFIISAGPKHSGCYHYPDVFDLATDEYKQSVAVINESVHDADPFLIYRTSGSTGLPKAVVISHRTLLNCITEGITHRYGYKGYEQDWETKYILTSVFSGSSAYNGVLIPLIRGCTTVIPYANYDAKLLAEAIQNEKCTEGLLYVYQLSDLIVLKEKRGYDFSSMKIAMPGGSTFSLALRRKAAEAGLAQNILMCYGATEMSDIFLQHPLDTQKYIEEGAYFPCGGTEVKVIDESGQIMPIGTAGEICVRGFSLFSYYFGNEAKTKKAKDSKGWYHTNDIGVMDSQGFIRITDRKSDFIMTSYINLPPSSLESVLYQHPDIQDVVVIGVPGERKAEEVCVCIIPQSSASTRTLDQLKDFAKEKDFPHHAVIRYRLYFDEFPRTVEGKFYRKQLRQLAIKRLELESGSD